MPGGTSHHGPAHFWRPAILVKRMRFVSGVVPEDVLLLGSVAAALPQDGNTKTGMGGGGWAR